MSFDNRLLKFDDSFINYQQEWEKTFLYKFFKKKKPSHSWKIQLIRIMGKNNNNINNININNNNININNNNNNKYKINNNNIKNKKYKINNYII